MKHFAPVAYHWCKVYHQWRTTGPSEQKKIRRKGIKGDGKGRKREEKRGEKSRKLLDKQEFSFNP